LEIISSSHNSIEKEALFMLHREMMGIVTFILEGASVAFYPHLGLFQASIDALE